MTRVKTIFRVAKEKQSFDRACKRAAERAIRVVAERQKLHESLFGLKEGPQFLYNKQGERVY